MKASVVYLTGKRSPGAAVKLLPCDHEVMGSSLETASCRNAGKGCIHKFQSGRTLPWTGPSASGSYVHQAAL
jgi:hypothetical protein